MLVTVFAPLILSNYLEKYRDFEPPSKSRQSSGRCVMIKVYINQTEVVVMELSSQSYSDQLAAELRGVPEEYMPALIDMIHAFRAGVIQKSFEEDLQASFRNAKAGKTFPIETLWDGIDH